MYSLLTSLLIVVKFCETRLVVLVSLMLIPYKFKVYNSHTIQEKYKIIHFHNEARMNIPFPCVIDIMTFKIVYAAIVISGEMLFTQTDTYLLAFCVAFA